MAVLKCKMCGGDLVVQEGVSTAECEYCGSLQTVPKVDDEKKLTLFSRANRLRAACEFDKAAGIYESIVADFPEEAEAYWGLVLCKYGIEYVDDPATGNKIPTCHRSSFESIMEDSDYEQAVENADAVAKKVYREEAKAFERIRKGIIAVSANEEPYDIFICYKETDENNDRTLDSVLAQDLYTALTDKGYRVFFSRITLRGILGVDFEPYIFAALNSAKVMLAVGTSYEYYNSVWVKNEWSRFLKLMAKDNEKYLIPCHKNLDPEEDMPKEFKHLQAADLGKMGAIQDILFNMEKYIPLNKQPEPIVQQTSAVVNSPAAPQLERAFMFLEDAQWDKADEYFEKVLDQDPKNARAYLGKLLVSFRLRKQSALKDQAEPFDNKDYYRKALRFADPELKNTLTGYIDHILERNYNKALQTLQTSDNLVHVNAAAEAFTKLGSYKDSSALVQKCKERADELATEIAYNAACNAMSQASKADTFLKLWDSFRGLSGYKDSDERAQACKEKAELLRKDDVYRRAESLASKLTEESWRNAAEMMRTIPGYRDADQLAKKYADRAEDARKRVIYDDAVSAKKRGENAKARDLFRKIPGYRDADSLAEQCQQLMDAKAAAYRRRRQTEKALKAAAIVGAVGLVVFLILLFALIIPGNKYKKADALCAKGDYLAAAEMFENLKKFKDSPTRYKDAMYKYADKLSTNGEIAKAAMTFGALENYKDARARSFALWDQVAVRETVSAGSYHTVAIKNDGTVVATGENDDGQCNVSEWTDIVAVSSGHNYTIGLKADGTVVATGDNEEGQCNVSEWKDIVSISAGGGHTLGLKNDGTVVAVGANLYKQCDLRQWKNIAVVAAGGSQSYGLTVDGTVVVEGGCFFNQDVAEEWTGIVAITNSSDHIIGLKADGTVVAAGSNYDAKSAVHDWSNIVCFFACGNHSLGLRADGSWVTAGNNSRGQCDVSAWTDIVALTGGFDHSIGLKADGTLVATGLNSNGQCDVSGWTDIKIPQK